MNITPRERRNLALIGTGILLVLVWGIGIRPWLEGPLFGSERRALLERAREARRLLARAEAIVAHHRVLSAAVEEAEKDYPAETEPARAAVGIFRLLEGFASASGLSLRSRGIRTTAAEENPPRVRIELEALGSPVAVVGFLDRVRLSPVRLGIERLEIVPEEGRRLRLYVLLVTLLPRAMAELVEAVPAIATIKLEDTPTPQRIAQTLKLTGDRVTIVGGLGGMYLLDELRAGASGTMTGFAYPEVLVAIWRAWQAGDRAGAAERYYRALPALVFEGQPRIGLAIRKETQRRRRLIAHATVRHPGPVLDEQTLEALTEVLEWTGLPAAYDRAGAQTLAG